MDTEIGWIIIYISAKTFDKTLDNGEQVDKKMRIGIQNVVKYLINTYGGGYSWK